MTGEKNLSKLLQGMTPVLNDGTYVFSTVKDSASIHNDDILSEFKEKEGTTIIISKDKADTLNLPYTYIASWLTLMIHSSLDAVGLTAVFSTALAKHNVSCNVVAGYYHDHIFVAVEDTEKALSVLTAISKK